MGTVPRIVFVKDKCKGRFSELNHILTHADYGQDFTPLYHSLLNTDHMDLSDLKTLENLALNDLNEIPPMRNDVFKLDHTAIMYEVKKSKTLHEKGGPSESIVGNSRILGEGENAKTSSL